MTRTKAADRVNGDGGELATSEGAETTAGAAVEATAAEVEATPATEPARKKTTWHEFLATASLDDVRKRFTAEIADILKSHGLADTCCLALLQPVNSIDTVDLDNVFAALSQTNSDHSKDVVLFLLSRGGEGEPAYQISKICKSFAREKFKVAVPRLAKSAATLIAIGADEIHMGPLGQLGPIDPQIGGLPALGVSQALKTIASVASSYPKSAEMFARYLRLALTVEQIGYCDRIAESAVQYAERLLSTKAALVSKASVIAKELVHEYKDHGFVIDLAEAKKHLGEDWILTDTPELKAAESIYSRFEMVNFFLGFAKSKRIVVSGSATDVNSILIFDTKSH
jgi:Serine dehydrogenase proteinase